MHMNVDVIRGCHISAEIIGQDFRGMILLYIITQHLQSLMFIIFLYLSKQTIVCVYARARVCVCVCMRACVCTLKVLILI